MPKKIDPKVRERTVRQVLEHLPEFASLTAAPEVIARREGLGKETVRRWACFPDRRRSPPRRDE